MNIIVTGSNGCLGSALNQTINHSHWYFVNRKDCDLSDRKATISLFNRLHADYLVHLASYVPGFYDIDKVKSFSENVRINENVLEAAHLSGIERGLFCLSVNMCSEFGENEVINESRILEGSPFGLFQGYGYAKKMLYLQMENYNSQYGRKYFGIIPCNIFGPNDNLKSGRLIPNLILKFKKAIEENTNVIINGSGKPVRQFIYSYDLAKIINFLILNYQDNKPIICCSDVEISIYDLVYKIGELMDFKNKIEFDTSKPDGHLKRTMDNIYLKKIMGKDLSFTSLYLALRSTIDSICE